MTKFLVLFLGLFGLGVFAGIMALKLWCAYEAAMHLLALL